MKPVKLRDMSIDELRAEQQNLSEELFRLRFRRATGELEKPSKIRSVRRDIARINTVMWEKVREGHGRA